MSAIVALIAVAIAGLALDPSCSNDVRSDIPNLERVIVKNAERDARLALKRGERHFLGLAMFTVETPGISKQFSACPEVRGRTRFICGTSDMFYGEGHLKLIRRAETYAIRYNKVIERTVKQELKRECSAL